MQVFSCPTCAAPIWFHNLGCTCGQAVVFDPDAMAMQTAGATCANRDTIACNWGAGEGGLCRSCAMTETVPDLCAEGNLPLWRRTEHAKRWMLASLARWGWFTPADPGARPVSGCCPRPPRRARTMS